MIFKELAGFGKLVDFAEKKTPMSQLVSTLGFSLFLQKFIVKKR